MYHVGSHKYPYTWSTGLDTYVCSQGSNVRVMENNRAEKRRNAYQQTSLVAEKLTYAGLYSVLRRLPFASDPDAQDSGLIKDTRRCSFSAAMRSALSTTSLNS